MTTLLRPERLDIEVVRDVSHVVRAIDTTADDGRLTTMEIRFSRFNDWYEIDSWFEGHFLERTQRGAFARTINAHNARTVRSAGVKVLFNHGRDMYVNDKLLGPIDELREDPDSPVGIVGLDDTSYGRDLLPALRRGDYGSSFMFRVLADEWNYEPGESEHNPDGIPERTITEVKLFEFGPVTWPANPSATAQANAARSGTDDYYETLARVEPARAERARTRAIGARTPDRPAPAASTVDGQGPATATPSDPASRHSDGMTPAQRRLVLHPFLGGTSHESRSSAGAAR